MRRQLKEHDKMESNEYESALEMFDKPMVELGENFLDKAVHIGTNVMILCAEIMACGLFGCILYLGIFLVATALGVR
jgi:hypothetical protein